MLERFNRTGLYFFWRIDPLEIDESSRKVPEYHWHTRRDIKERLSVLRENGYEVSGLRRCSKREADAWLDGFDEGADWAVIGERIGDYANGNSISMSLDELLEQHGLDSSEDANLNSDVFICGKCSKHLPNSKNSGETVYIGLYGTPWMICKSCKKGN